jgi:hypothetical protein
MRKTHLISRPAQENGSLEVMQFDHFLGKFPDLPRKAAANQGGLGVATFNLWFFSNRASRAACGSFWHSF